MTASERKATHRAWLERALAEGDDAVLERSMSPAHVLHVPAGPPVPPGARGARLLLGRTRAAFDGWVVRVLEQVASDERVVTRFEAACQHVRPMGPLPSNGAWWTFRGLLATRFAGALAYETRLELNLLEELLRHGAVGLRPGIELVPPDARRAGPADDAKEAPAKGEEVADG